MGEEIAFEMAEFPTWPWPWIGSYCIPSCITHRPLPIYQMSLKLKKLIVDGWRDGRTFETQFIMSTWTSRPNNENWCMYIVLFISCLAQQWLLHVVYEEVTQSRYPQHWRITPLKWKWSDEPVFTYSSTFNWKTSDMPSGHKQRQI